MTLPPAQPGMPLDAVDTPALILDLDAFEANLAAMKHAVAGRAVLRPHAKTHKSAVIARQQMALGAVGVCAQKVSEAEALVLRGVDDVLVANEVIGMAKLRRLAALATRARIALCCDSAVGVAQANAAAADAGVSLDVLIEINAGSNRAGIDVGPGLVDLARRVASSSQLKLRGIQAYHGPSQHLRGYAERQAATAGAAAAARAGRDMLIAAGLPCPVVTGAGTGTFQFAADSGIYTELQPGSYVFMDADYAKNRGQNEGPFSVFRQSLFVLTTVFSSPGGGRAMVDAGHKTLPIDSGLPVVFGREDLVYSRPADEAALLVATGNGALPAVGERLLLVPSHCDPTVNLHDWYVCLRKGRVEAVWPVDARGAIY